MTSLDYDLKESKRGKVSDTKAKKSNHAIIVGVIKIIVLYCYKQGHALLLLI